MKVSECPSRPILSPCGLKELDYQVDTYIGCGHYCYYCYVFDQAETDWSKEILMHSDIVGQLSEELESISPQTIYMGYHTDPYQPCEADYRQTRKVLELLLQKGFSHSILTKSDLVIRDIDILEEMNDAAVSVSVAFLTYGAIAPGCCLFPEEPPICVISDRDSKNNTPNLINSVSYYIEFYSNEIWGVHASFLDVYRADFVICYTHICRYGVDQHPK